MSDLQERLDRAERALTRAGFTLLEGAQEWKPPIGTSASPLLDRIDLLAFLLRELRDGVEGEWCFPGNLDERINAALAGKLPERSDTEWTDATSAPTAEDYRELQAQHDQLQSRLKAAMDTLGSAVKTAEFEGHANRPWRDYAKALLADNAPMPEPAPVVLEAGRPRITGVLGVDAGFSVKFTDGLLCAPKMQFNQLAFNGDGVSSAQICVMLAASNWLAEEAARWKDKQPTYHCDFSSAAPKPEGAS